MKLNKTRVTTLILAGSLALALGLAPVLAHAEEDELATQEQNLTEEAKRPGFEAELKERFALTDEQLKALRDQGMNDSQITIAAQLAKSSGKSIDEVAQMRNEQKMGWGKIAKELGVHPGEIGRGVSEMHRLPKDKAEKRAERVEKRMAKKQEKAERRQGKKKEK